MRRRSGWGWANIAVGFGAALVVALLGQRGIWAQEPGPPLAPGQEAEGEIRTRLGDLWTIALCEGDAVFVEAAADDFNPYIDWYAPGDDEPVDGAEGDEGEALLETGALAASGVYTIGITGERRTDRGPYSLRISLDGAPAGEEPDGFLAPGAPVTDSVRTRFGDLWQIHLCAGEPYTVTMASDGYDPYLGLMAVEDGDLLAEAEGAEGAALLSIDPLEEITDLQINAGGMEQSDRGAYSLMLQSASSGSASAPDPTATRTPTRAPTRAPTRTPAPTAAATATCSVLVDQLNLRAGPGTQYTRLAQLSTGTALRPLARDAASDWIEVTVTGSGQRGWVLAIPDYVSCSVAVGSLAVVAAPPTPTPLPTSPATPTPTATPTLPAPILPPATPTSTPTLPALVILPAPSNDVLPGDIYTGPGMASSIDFDNRVTTFRDRFYLRMEPGETNPPVDRVTFRVYDPEDPEFTTLHERSEGTAGYCIFGGGEPICNTLELNEGALWPSSGLPVVNGRYNVDVNVYLQGDDVENPTGRWFGAIIIDSPRLPDAETESEVEPETEPLPLQVELRETGPGTLDSVLFGQISFRVAAWDPTVGNNDGDGIDGVFLRIFDPFGNQVYERREGTAGYCAFSGGEPECSVYDYAAAGYTWPDGTFVTTGVHTLSAEVVADDGRTTRAEWSVDIQ